MSEISANIIKLMELEGISPSELSRKTGVDRSVLHKILTGATKNPSIDSIKTIIQRYGFEEVVLGVKSSKNEIPLLSWSEVANLSHSQISASSKKIKIGITVPKTAFALPIEYTLDSRFPAGMLLIVDIERNPKNLSYVIVTERETKSSSLKRYILDGSMAYLKSIEPSIPSVKFEPKKIRIIGVVIQSIFDFE